MIALLLACIIACLLNCLFVMFQLQLRCGTCLFQTSIVITCCTFQTFHLISTDLIFGQSVHQPVCKLVSLSVSSSQSRFLKFPFLPTPSRLSFLSIRPCLLPQFPFTLLLHAEYPVFVSVLLFIQCLEIKSDAVRPSQPQINKLNFQ